MILPSNRDENWKYAALRPLATARLQAPDAVRTIADELLAALPQRITNHVRLVLQDGRWSSALSDALPPGVTVVRGSSPVSPSADATDADRRLAALNAREAQETLRIEVATGAHAEFEIVVLCSTPATAGMSHPSIRIELGAAAQISLLERQLGSDESCAGNLALSLHLARDATARITRVQAFGARTQWFETLDYHLEQNAHCDVVHVLQGAAAARTTAFVAHAGRGARLDWSTVALGEGQQVQDCYVRVHHGADDARTVQRYRGIVADRARLGFNGHMQVAERTSGCASDQSLRCLIAGEQAEADVRPQLEIHTDAVRASHGATVGKLDADMKFYLASRGIEPAVAEALLKWAFIADVLQHIEPPELRIDVERSLAARLPGALPAGVLA